MNTTENNTKIAKFLGYEITEGSQGKGITRQGKHISLNKLKFHNDWNWLAECVKKSQTLIYEPEFKYRVEHHLTVMNLDNTYKAILDFIEWAQTK